MQLHWPQPAQKRTTRLDGGGAGRRKNCTTQADDGELEVDSPFMEAGMDSLGLTGLIFTLPVVRFLNRFVPADATLVDKVFPASL